MSASFNDGLRTDDAVITSGTNVTPAIHLGSRTLAGFYFPPTMTSASLAIEASPDGASWYSIPTDTGTYAVASDLYQAVDPAYFIGIRYIRFVGSNEAADRTIKAISCLI